MSADKKPEWMQKRLDAFSVALDALTEGLTALDAASVTSIALQMTEGTLDGIDAAIEDRE